MKPQHFILFTSISIYLNITQYVSDSDKGCAASYQTYAGPSLGGLSWVPALQILVRYGLNSNVYSCLQIEGTVTFELVLKVFSSGTIVIFYLTEITYITLVSDQVQQVFLDSQQVGCGCHHYIDQDLWNNGDEGVLPGERVEEGCHCMNDLG